MFSQLIESGSHAADLKRKGRFFLGTTLFYAVLLFASGVGSIYAYNAQLADPGSEYELLTLMRFPPAETRSEPARREEPRPAAAPARTNQFVTRTEISEITPFNGDRIARADTPVTRPGQAVRIGDFNSPAEVSGGPVGPVGPGTPGPATGGRDAGPAVNDTEVAPAPTPRPTPAPTPKQPEGPLRLPSSVITSKVIEKPAPPYPAIAKAANVQGAVAVQILIDEQGRVVSANATSGHPLLRQAAVQAAYRARFTPTLLSNQPVKVTGSITYNFVLN
ncbi:MAG TPA: energy transducer TonB [Pyrinomonadaceae bacterium]|nr:energy transducer TonB [Pyrinomonadaceae bacterium]